MRGKRGKREGREGKERGEREKRGEREEKGKKTDGGREWICWYNAKRRSTLVIRRVQRVLHRACIV